MIPGPDGRRLAPLALQRPTHPPEHLPEQPPYRPPSEAASVLVRVTRGCAWNRCAFCNMYKNLQFEPRPMEDISRDLASLRALHPHARALFLADSDSLEHPHLAEIVAEVRRVFPEAERLTSYARLTTLRRLGPATLAGLRAAGLDRIHAGLESGSPRVLRRVRKGLRPELAIEGGCLAVAAGFELSLYVLCGLGGEEDWEAHARESAAVVSAVWPHFLRLRSLVLLPGTPLREEHEAGTFRAASPLTRLREVRRLIEQLQPPEPSPPGHALEVCSDHVSNLVWCDRKQVYRGVNGALPARHAAMLAELDAAIALVEAGRQVVDPGTLALRGRVLEMYAPARL
jgi:radical SAM superfamily enzyme YgiQ (UPF0313 family)